MAEGLCSGLQLRVRRFESDSSLQLRPSPSAAPVRGAAPRVSWASEVVPGERLELSHGRPYQILSLARLPISPPRQRAADSARNGARVNHAWPSRRATDRGQWLPTKSVLKRQVRRGGRPSSRRSDRRGGHSGAREWVGASHRPWRVSSPKPVRKRQECETRLGSTRSTAAVCTRTARLVTTDQHSVAHPPPKCRDNHTDSWYCPVVR